MDKILVIPDSFKGTMDSMRVCTIMERSIRRSYPDARIISIPVADGGEGTVEAFLTAMGGERVPIEVTGPYHAPVKAHYGIVDGDTAVIEMAACAGLPLVGQDMHPDRTTTYGVGEIMLNAARRGCTRIIVGLGGSSTNDGGAGAAAATGVEFRDHKGNIFIPTGGTLSHIGSIDVSRMDPALEDVEIITMCDIDNPLYGDQGAAYVFGPQKGADEKMVAFLDDQLRAFDEVITRCLGKEVSLLPGAGAAGGMGGGMVAFFDARLEMGIEVVLDTVRFDDLLEGSDMVFTGEGKLDTQSLRGKVVVGIARRTKPMNVPLVAVVGDIGDSVEAVYEQGVSAIFSINRVARDFLEVKRRAEQDLELTMDNLMRFLHRLQV